MRRFLTITTVIFLLTAACYAHAAYETGGVVKTILSNGVTLLVKPEPESKVASIEVFVRVGALDESDSNAGIGQLLAGSILAKTERYSTMKLARLVTEAGGNFRAQWQWNYIEVYAVTLPNKCEEGISLLADAIKNSTLDPLAIELSRSMILKEMGKLEEDPFNSAYSSARKLLYGGSPYGRPYLGRQDTIRRLSRKDVYAFYQRTFSPHKIVVAVVGDVNPDRVARKVEAVFKNMGMIGSPGKVVAPSSVGQREINLQSKGKASYIVMGYPAPGVEDADYLPMRIADVLLGGNKSSLLFTKLRGEHGLGYQVGSQYAELKGGSFIAAYAGIDSGRGDAESVKTIKSVMKEQVKALCNGSFTEEDLERAKKYLIGRHALKHERTRDRAFLLGWAEVMGLGYQYDLHNVYSKRVNDVTRDDVIQACRRFLNEPVIVVLSGNSGS